MRVKRNRFQWSSAIRIDIFVIKSNLFSCDFSWIMLLVLISDESTRRAPRKAASMMYQCCTGALKWQLLTKNARKWRKVKSGAQNPYWALMNVILIELAYLKLMSTYLISVISHANIRFLLKVSHVSGKNWVKQSFSQTKRSTLINLQWYSVRKSLRQPPCNHCFALLPTLRIRQYYLNPIPK